MKRALCFHGVCVLGGGADAVLPRILLVAKVLYHCNSKKLFSAILNFCLKYAEASLHTHTHTHTVIQCRMTKNSLRK